MQSLTCFASAFRRHTRGRDCEAGSPIASELLDGTRPSVLALKIHAVLHTGNSARSTLFEYFEYFVVSFSHAVLFHVFMVKIPREIEKG